MEMMKIPNLTIYLAPDIYKWIEDRAALEQTTMGKFSRRMLLKSINVFGDPSIDTVQECLDSLNKILEDKLIWQLSAQVKKFWISRLEDKLKIAEKKQKSELKQFIKLLQD